MTSTKRMGNIAYMCGIAPFIFGILAVVLIVNHEAIEQVIKSALITLL
ncbi:MAG: hypothetical protein ACXV5P_08555 [Halobacteriota archaeon]